MSKLFDFIAKKIAENPELIRGIIREIAQSEPVQDLLKEFVNANDFIRTVTEMDVFRVKKGEYLIIVLPEDSDMQGAETLVRFLSPKLGEENFIILQAGDVNLIKVGD